MIQTINIECPISDKVRFLRKSAELSRDDFADYLGYSERTIASWERGERVPGYDGIVSLAMFFGVSADWLLGIKEVQNNG